MSSRRNQLGASLIEALVAMLVLAIGVMGLASTQIRTLITARTTELRAVAMQAADDLQDRIQANSEIRLKPPAEHPYLTSWGEPPPMGADCRTVPCDGVQLASFDMAQWKSGLARALPEGDARVFASDKDPSQFGILVAWKATADRSEGVSTPEEEGLLVQAAAAPDARGAADSRPADEACPRHHICHLAHFRP